MNWPVLSLNGRGVVEYKLPARCPRCQSRDIYAVKEQRGDGPYVVESCPECDHNVMRAIQRAR